MIIFLSGSGQDPGLAFLSWRFTSALRVLTSPLLSHSHTLLLSPTLSTHLHPDISVPTNHLPRHHLISRFLQINKNHPQVFLLLQLTNYENSICHVSTCNKFKLQVHVVNFYNLSHSPFNQSFAHLHCMLQQLNAPV